MHWHQYQFHQNFYTFFPFLLVKILWCLQLSFIITIRLRNGLHFIPRPELAEFCVKLLFDYRNLCSLNHKQMCYSLPCIFKHVMVLCERFPLQTSQISHHNHEDSSSQNMFFHILQSSSHILSVKLLDHLYLQFDCFRLRSFKLKVASLPFLSILLKCLKSHQWHLLKRWCRRSSFNTHDSLAHIMHIQILAEVLYCNSPVMKVQLFS